MNEQTPGQPISDTTQPMDKPAPQTDPAIGTKPPGPSGKAITALILGILSIICCGFLVGVPAIIIGKLEMNAFKRGETNKTSRDLAQIGFITGIVGTSLTCLATILWLILVAIGASGEMMNNM